MIINIDQLVENVKVTFPTIKVEVTTEDNFYEIKAIGVNNAICYFYPNDLAWFVKLYETQEAYENHVMEDIRRNLILN